MRYTVGCLTVAYLPVNAAWAVLWGRGPLHELTILRIFPVRGDALAYAQSLA